MSIHLINHIEIHCDQCGRVTQVLPPRQSFTGTSRVLCDACTRAQQISPPITSWTGV